MAGPYERPGLEPESEPDGMGVPVQPPSPLRAIAPSRWAMLAFNVVLFVVCTFALATSPLVPWYHAPSAGAAPLIATPSPTAFYAPPTSPLAPVAATPTPTSSGGGPAPTPTHSPTPLGPPSATPTPIAPSPTATFGEGN